MPYLCLVIVMTTAESVFPCLYIPARIIHQSRVTCLPNRSRVFMNAITPYIELVDRRRKCPHAPFPSPEPWYLPIQLFTQA